MAGGGSEKPFRNIILQKSWSLIPLSPRHLEPTIMWSWLPLVLKTLPKASSLNILKIDTHIDIVPDTSSTIDNAVAYNKKYLRMQVNCRNKSTPTINMHSQMLPKSRRLPVLKIILMQNVLSEYRWKSFDLGAWLLLKCCKWIKITKDFTYI